MSERLKVHEFLETIAGNKNVYYQPPETVKMKYPAIVYFTDNINKRYADDGSYLLRKMYGITVIDKDPESEIADKLMILPKCRFERHYVSSNLHHFVFTLYF